MWKLRGMCTGPLINSDENTPSKGIYKLLLFYIIGKWKEIK
jgi:hypothetical protein